VKCGLDRRKAGGLLSATVDVAVARELSVMTARWHSASGDAADASVVVVKVLLSVVVCVASHHRSAGLVLNRRHVVGREGALQSGRRRVHVVIARRIHDATRRLGRVLRDVLKIKRVAERVRSAADAGKVPSLGRRRTVDGREALLRAVTVNTTPAVDRRCFRVRRRGEREIERGRRR